MVRILGFFHNELLTVFRQPRLLLTLVVGPFLILLIFGLGYRDDPPPFRTLLVLQSDQAQLAADHEDLGEAFGRAITLEGTATDLDAATEQLENGEVDLLIVAPDDPLASLEAGERAEFQVIHGEVDPVMRSNIELLSRLSVDEINRRVLSGAVTMAQERTDEAEDPLRGAKEASSALVAALEARDREGADAQLARLDEELDAAAARSARGASLYASVASAVGESEVEVFDGIAQSVETAGSDDLDTALRAARQVDSSLADLEAGLDRAEDLDPELLVSPFGAEVRQVNAVSTQPAVIYSPGTIVVLLQHLAITFAALSLVRERQLGLTEVFRASPLGSGEAVVGKYLGFGALGLVVAAALTGAMVGFGVTIRGSLVAYSVVLGLVLVAAIGLGFVISGISKTDTQAVQYAMITLLLSIFFTGFVLPLEQLAEPVQVISYLIPATYGIRALQDVVFRGAGIDPLLLAGLATYAGAMAVGAWLVVRRDVVFTGNDNRA